MKITFKLIRTPILLFLFLFFVMQIFGIKGTSMQKTLIPKDFVFVSLFSYGVPIPTIYSLNQPLLPDFFDNGHIIKGDGPEHGDIVAIRHFKNGSYENYLKRCFATGGDEIILTENKAYLNSKTFDKTTSKGKKVILNNEEWLLNPYVEIFYGMEDSFTYFRRTKDDVMYSDSKRTAVKPIFVKEIKGNQFKHNGEIYNAFYYKVPDNEYFMMGDNFNLSTDSRNFGSVKYKDIIGKILGTIYSDRYKEVN